MALILDIAANVNASDLLNAVPALDTVVQAIATAIAQAIANAANTFNG